MFDTSEDHLSTLDGARDWYLHTFAPEECPLTRIPLSTQDEVKPNSSQADDIDVMIQQLQEEGLLLDRSYETWLKRMADHCPLTRDDSRVPFASYSPSRSDPMQFPFTAGIGSKSTGDNANTSQVEIEMRNR